jgi:hypothetical protein
MSGTWISTKVGDRIQVGEYRDDRGRGGDGLLGVFLTIVLLVFALWFLGIAFAVFALGKVIYNIARGKAYWGLAAFWLAVFLVVSAVEIGVYDAWESAPSSSDATTR